ncbi:hypothetical protein [Paraburkholderia youngii]|uniref:hypothetical protein n=1 Tax=Paraburkholderia youngii TaxID=2782701 RepID=UPI003D2512A0
MTFLREEALDSLLAEFTGRVCALGYSSIVACTGSDTERAYAVFLGPSVADILGPYYDMEEGNKLIRDDKKSMDTKNLCVDVWRDEWPPSGGDARVDPPPSRVLSITSTTKYETASLTPWYPEDVAPSRDGTYQVLTEEGVRFSTYQHGDWVDGTPAKWRGLDWRLSDSEADAYEVLFGSGDVHAGIALVRHAYASRTETGPEFGTDDEWAMKASVFSRVLMKSDAGKHLLDPSNGYFPSLKPKGATRRAILAQANAFESGEEP